MTIAARMKRSSRTGAPNRSTASCRAGSRLRLSSSGPKASSIGRLREEQDAERRDRASRAAMPRGAAGTRANSMSDAEDDDHDERDHERRSRCERRSRRCPSQRPERVAGDHRDRARREVDHPRAAIEEDEAERDAGDQRAFTEAAAGRTGGFPSWSRDPSAVRGPAGCVPRPTGGGQRFVVDYTPLALSFFWSSIGTSLHSLTASTCPRPRSGRTGRRRRSRGSARVLAAVRAPAGRAAADRATSRSRP